jgi:hypothetical protein
MIGSKAGRRPFGDQLCAYDLYVAGSVDSQPDLPSLEPDDRDTDVVTDKQLFHQLAGQHQHFCRPLKFAQVRIQPTFRSGGRCVLSGPAKRGLMMSLVQIGVACGLSRGIVPFFSIFAKTARRDHARPPFARRSGVVVQESSDEGSDRWTSLRIMAPYKGTPRVVSWFVDAILFESGRGALALRDAPGHLSLAGLCVRTVGIGAAGRPTRERGSCRNRTHQSSSSGRVRRD